MRFQRYARAVTAEGRDYEPAFVLLERILTERRRRWEQAGRRGKYQEPAAPDTSNLPELPEGWCWASPGQPFRWASGNFLPKKEQRLGRVPVFGGNGIGGYHDEATIEAPTLVVGRVGAQCGNLHLTDGPAWITDNAIYAVDVSESVYLPWWHAVMSSVNLNANAGGTGQPYVNQMHLNELCVPLPPLDEQHRIVSELRRIQSIVEAAATCARDSIVRSQRLRQSILKWAFEGKLADQDPNDEPASVLLERIKAERDAAGSTRGRSGRRGVRRVSRTAVT